MDHNQIEPAATIADLLRWRAASDPGMAGYTFLSDGENARLTLTYGELHARACIIAEEVQCLVAPGARALLAYPPGLDYITAFFGCLYADVIAVPAYPPNPGRAERTLTRLQGIIANARPEIVLTTSSLLPVSDELVALDRRFKQIHWLTTDGVVPGTAFDRKPHGSDSDAIAFLQYTSGSTSAPKGVALSHRNLLSNLALIAGAFGHSRESRGVIWLPPYHDMGLIGGILQPLYMGFPVTLISPVSFLQRPLRWLRAISACSATTSGGPNFAYDLCARRADTEDCSGLDLSSWRVAFNGAEPVRAETMDRFSRAFAPYGFRREAFLPCYGLAESTLMVSCGRLGTLPMVAEFDAAGLEENKAVLISEFYLPPTPSFRKEGEQEKPLGVQEADADNPARPPYEGGREPERAGGASVRILVSSGPAVPGNEVILVNPATGEICPENSVGEIWVSGASIAQGYWGNPEASAETFQANLPDNPDTRFLRTGDLGFLHDNELFVTGRIKDLIIIRGRNHYPQDIEATVQACHPGLRVGAGAAVSIESDGEERLVIIQEIERGARRDDPEAMAQTIRSAVSEQHELQVYAVALVAPGRIPKTSSGKVQRHACKAGFLDGTLDLIASSKTEGNRQTQSITERPALSRETLAVLTGQEQVDAVAARLRWDIAAAIRMDVQQLSVDTAVSGLGLDSLMAVELQYGIESELGVMVPMVRFLAGASISEIAESVCEDLRGQPDACVAPDESGVSDVGQYPLSFSQEQLWFLDRLEPGSHVYNIAATLRMRGTLDAEALSYALTEIVRRHGALRTSFPLSGGAPMQHVAHLAAFQLDTTNLRDAPVAAEHGDDLEAAALALARIEARRPFALETGPLFRGHLIRIGAQDHLLALTMHHIISDGWAMGVLVRELTEGYTAAVERRPSKLQTPPISFGALCARQRSDAALTHAGLPYWRKQLAGPLPKLDLTLDRQRPPSRTTNGAVHTANIPESEVEPLRTIAREHGATLYMALCAAFVVLMHRYTGEEDIIIGTRVNGRTQARTESLIGFFVNALPLRVTISGDPSYLETLGRVRETCLGAFAHQDTPFDLLVKEIHMARDVSRHPLFTMMFVLQNFRLPELNLPGLTVEAAEIANGTSKFDADFALRETPGGIEAAVEYNTDLFDPATITRMAGHFRVLLNAIAAQPERPIAVLPLLTEGERRQMLVDWNDTAFALPEGQTLPGIFANQAARTPDAPAVSHGTSRLTFMELDARSNKIAHQLQQHGVGPDTPVAVFIPRSIETLVSLLAVLKAGGAYVPLDPAYPPAQIAHILRDTGARVIITRSTLSDKLPPGEGPMSCVDIDSVHLEALPSSPPICRATLDHMSHILYTSGSTGFPKGVSVPHRQLLNRFSWLWSVYPFGEGEIACQRSSVNFSPSLWELLGPVLQGISVVILSDETIRDPLGLADVLATQKVTRVLLVPSILRALLDAARGQSPLFPDLRLIFTAGEPLSRDLLRMARERLPHVRIVNDYGSTETHGVLLFDTASVNLDEPGGTTVPVGCPIGNIRAYVLDSHGQPMPQGARGEIHIESAGLARGYVNLPMLTAERFVPHPFATEPGARLYRTGDIGRYLHDGSLEYLGRADFQVKVRGVRIEVMGIEALLREHESVEQAVVTAWPDQHGETRLAAYIVPARGTSPNASILRQYLTDYLPDTQIPAIFTILEKLPVLPSGKVDRRALPEPSGDRPDLAAPFTAPRTEIEGQIAAIWRTALEVDKVGIDDNFFELGGHSLLMARVQEMIRTDMGADITLVILFQHPTISALARHLTDKQPEPPSFHASRGRADARRAGLEQQRLRRRGA